MRAELLARLSRITEEERAFLQGHKEIARSRYMAVPEAYYGIADNPCNRAQPPVRPGRGRAEAADGDIVLKIGAERFMERGKLITLRPHTRFVHFPPHRHDYIEMVYMCQGQTRHIINGEEVRLRAGELLFLNPNAVQEVLPAGKEDLAVNFIIQPAFFDQPLRMMGEEDNQLRAFLVGCLKGEDAPVAYLHFQVADVPPVQNLMENLVWTLLCQQPNKRSINQITMGLLFLQLLNYTNRVRMGQAYCEQVLLLQVYSYVEAHYFDGSLAQLAALLHYDACNMSRLVRRLSGHTYTGLVQNKRLSQAAYLLQTTRMRVAEIGERVGYENLSYFHRLFQKRFGVSPKKYRDGAD